MINFAYIYALPGYTSSDIHKVETEKATFYAVAVDYKDKKQAAAVAKQLTEEEGVVMIELCGGLANADVVSQVKQAVGDNVAVGQVMYGPEYRRTLVDLLNV